MRIQIFTVLLLISFSCKKEEKSELVEKKDVLKTSSNSFEKLNSKNSEIKLDFFKTIPDTIDGSGEYYTIESENDDSEKFIFISNLTSFAIITVNGNNVFLEKDSINSKKISKDEFLDEYKGNGYKAIIKTKLIRQFDEVGFYTGTLKVIYKDDEIEYKIKGESGC